MSARRTHLIEEAVKGLQDRLGRNPVGSKERVDWPIARAFLMADSFFRDGNRCEPQAKHVGLKVYDVSVSKH